MDHSTKPTNLVLWVIFVVAVIAIAGGVIYVYLIKDNPTNSNIPSFIESFKYNKNTKQIPGFSENEVVQTKKIMVENLSRGLDKFSVSIPQNWQVIDFTRATSLYIQPPNSGPDDQLLVNPLNDVCINDIDYHTFPKESTLKPFWNKISEADYIKNRWQRHFGWVDETNIGIQKVTTVNTSGFQVTFNYNNSNSQQVQFCLLAPDLHNYINFTFNPSSKYAKEIQQIIGSYEPTSTSKSWEPYSQFFQYNSEILELKPPQTKQYKEISISYGYSKIIDLALQIPNSWHASGDYYSSDGIYFSPPNTSKDDIMYLGGIGTYCPREGNIKDFPNEKQYMLLYGLRPEWALRILPVQKITTPHADGMKIELTSNDIKQSKIDNYCLYVPDASVTEFHEYVGFSFNPESVNTDEFKKIIASLHIKY